MRTVIVLDDFVRDAGIGLASSQVIRGAERAAALKCQDLIRALGGAGDLWGRYWERYTNTHELFGSLPAFEAVSGKCSLVFLPFDLPLFRRHPGGSAAKKAISDYLFALQLLDDFADLAEDQRQTVNQNLFLLRVPEERWQELTERRAVFAAPLLAYIIQELSRTDVSGVGGRIRQRFGASIRWLSALARRLDSAPGVCTSSVFPEDFRRFAFVADPVLECALISRDSDRALTHIRAEGMHTATL
jgi:hypothetical protein